MTKDQLLAHWKTLPVMSAADLRKEVEKRAAVLAKQWREDCCAYLRKDQGWVLCQGRDSSHPRTEPTFIVTYCNPLRGGAKSAT